MMKRIIYIALPLILIGFLIYMKSTSQAETGMNPGNKKNVSVPVNVLIVKTASLSKNIEVTGTVNGYESVSLSPEISGKITGIYFTEGAFTGTGALLVKLNDADLQAQLKKAELALRFAQTNEERQKQLLDRKGVSQESYDAALYEVKRADAEIALIRAQIAKTEIRAPFSGIIGIRNVSLGAYVSPQTTIAVLQSVNPVKIDFMVPQQYLSIVKVGSTMRFKIPQSEDEYTAQVTAIDPQLDVATRTIRVRAATPNPTGTLMPGAYVNVTLLLSEEAETILLPSECVVPGQSGQSVYVFRSGAAVLCPVDIGARTDKSVQITSGIEIGDSVITTGIIQLKPNSAVTLAGVE